MDQQMEVYIFYFDVIGVVKEYLRDPGVLDRLTAFQRGVRGHTLGLGAEWTYVVTLYDSIWARISANEMNPDLKVLELAATAMKQARAHGFNKYFGVCTSGMHQFSFADKVLIGGAQPTDITYQHIDSVSEPQLRAGAAEKWSARLAKAQQLPVGPFCVWVSEEVADQSDLEAYEQSGSSFRILAPTFDLLKTGPVGADWPFPASSRFTPIGPR